MISAEEKEQRIQRVDMHDFFLKRIENAIHSEQYIEASWLIYSCFENRYFRTVEKIKNYCKYSTRKCKKSGNELALRTKVKCIQRLAEADCSCIRDNFTDELFEKTLRWIKARNKLMHNLLTLEEYEEMDDKFKQSAEEGIILLKQTYNACTGFRASFFDANYDFQFPECCMEKCSCKPRHNLGNM